MLRYNRNRARGRFFPLFSPRELFYGSVPGAWYDPTDLSTLFQDSAGTTPVTAVEQPVGLILDKSQGLTNGPELSPNVGPYTSTTDWTGINSAVLSASGGELVITSGNTYSGAYITASVVAGTWLDVTIVARRGTATAAYVSILNQTNTVIVDGFGNPNLAIGATNTTIRTRFLVPAGMTQARLLVIHDNQANNRTLFCSSASAKTLAGNHASQSTAASRPTHRARYNLLTYSEEFQNAAWTKTNVTVTANSDTAPDGTLTADTLAATAGNATTLSSFTAIASSYRFSVYLKRKTGTGNVDISADGVTYTTQAITSSWARYTVTQTLTAGAKTPGIRIVTNGDEVYAWGAQLLTAADVTATGNAYQRIAAATVYDTAPIFRPYLAFDGVDDSLATAAINFTSTDKMTVFAGVTKSSDATLGIVAELGNRNLVQAGSFTLNAPRAAGNPNYAFIIEGTAVTDNTITGYPAPITSVMTGRGDIAAPLNQLRVNGAVAGTLTTTLGTGNFGNWALNIGRRNNATLPFNGRLFSLIVRGAASSTTEIIDTETWVNQRTGGY